MASTGDHHEAMECTGVDELSAAVIVKVKRKGGWENFISIEAMLVPISDNFRKLAELNTIQLSPADYGYTHFSFKPK